MSRSTLAALLILAGYLYGTLLYNPWYTLVQKTLGRFGLVKESTDPNVKRLGNQVQIVIVALLLITGGIWLFIVSND